MMAAGCSLYLETLGCKLLLLHGGYPWTAQFDQDQLAFSEPRIILSSI
jgi:hypothetical protein